MKIFPVSENPLAVNANFFPDLGFLILLYQYNVNIFDNNNILIKLIE